MIIQSTVDLHTHSTASDGDMNPSAVVSLAHANGIRILSLTDHDTVDGLAEAEKEAEFCGMTFIPGIEISAQHEEELHILGYYIEKQTPSFQSGLTLLLEYREAREKITIDYLHGCGIDITAREVKAITKGKIIGRPHMAELMIRKGYVSTKKDAFDRYLGTDEYLSMERPKPSIEESIDIIKSGHGVPVLAHPHTLRQSSTQLDETLGQLKEMGIKGMECYYNSYNQEDVSKYLTLANKHGLVPVGGSDFHGSHTKPDVRIGSGKDNMLSYNNLDIAEVLRNLKS
jgi:predicted metal-dependent phosphoesterase TrpH